MKVGFSGRPSPPKDMRAPIGSTPRERMQRYVSTCSELKLGCLEVPATLLFGRGDWRNQFLSACTEPVRAETRQGPSSVDVLVRVRFADGVDIPASGPSPCRGASLAYARHLIRLFGGTLVTLQFKASHASIVGESYLPPGGSGAAKVGLVVNFADQSAVQAAARIVRKSRHYMMLPLLPIGPDNMAKTGRQIMRALTVCHNENGGGGIFVYLALPRARSGSTPISSRNCEAILETTANFQRSKGSDAGLLFSGPGAEQLAHGVAKLATTLYPASAGLDTESDLVTRIGSTVRIRDVELGLDMEYFIVPPEQASAINGLLSSESPVGRAIIGQPSGSTVQVAAPGGPVTYELLEVLNR
ncbi:MAG: GreA/GreB family elongation factor [Firmicutes bacterium]|jgi:hypothetical protein|nr:GreA/GreB family elongation factor [Bacillota bacterium]MDD4335816.1 GreA/GreB family elongation factor [Bacillota bacterium]MDD4792069.1 GreA/GreB family elongation factor [Bacillota bacterium]